MDNLLDFILSLITMAAFVLGLTFITHCSLLLNTNYRENYRAEKVQLICEINDKYVKDNGLYLVTSCGTYRHYNSEEFFEIKKSAVYDLEIATYNDSTWIRDYQIVMDHSPADSSSKDIRIYNKADEIIINQ